MQQNNSIIRNICAIILYQFVAFCFGVLIPQLILKHYGASMHGLTSTVTNLAQYILLLNTGIVNVAMNALYKPFAQGNYTRINEITNALRLCNTRMGNISLLLIIALSLLLSALIHTDGLSGTVVFLMCLVMGLQQVFERYLVCTYQIIIQSDQKTYIIYVINTITYILRGCLQTFLIINGISLIIVQAIPTLMIFFSWYMLRRYIKQKYKFLDKLIQPDNKVLRSRKFALSHTLAGVVVNNSSTLLLSIFCNQVAVSIYAVYNLIVSHLHGFIVTVLSRSALTSVGKTLTTQTKKQIEDKFSTIELTFCIAISFSYSLCANLIMPFVKLYTASQPQIDYINYPLMYMIIAFGILNGIREPAIMMIDASAYYQKTQRGAVLEVLINLVFSTLGTFFFGVSGVLLGVVVAFLFRYIDVTRIVNRNIFKRSSIRSFRRGGQTFLIVAIIYALLHTAFQAYIRTWREWLIGAITISIISGIFNFIVFYLTDKSSMQKLIGIIWRRIQRK